MIRITAAHSPPDSFSATMSRPATNTLILTKLDKRIEDDPGIIAGLVAKGNFNVELISLPRFSRIILVCVSSSVAAMLRDHLSGELGTKALISFSLKDNHSKVLENDNWAIESDNMDYLELPSEEGSRRFLISPPLSPHTEWNDYSKTEEGPNRKTIYSPDELSHLLWDRLGGFESSQVQKYSDESFSEEQQNPENQDYGDELKYTEKEVFDISKRPEILFEAIENGTPAIVVDKVGNQQKNCSYKLPRTSIPPPL